MATINKYLTKTGAQRYRVLWRDPSGRQKSKSFDKWQNANDFRIKVEHELRESSYVEPIKLTVSEYMDEWFAIHKRSLQPSTAKAYEYNIVHIKDEIGDKYLQRLTPGDIETMYKSLSNLAGKTLREVHSVLNLALRAAVKKRYLATNPCDAVDRPRAVKFQASFVHPDNVSEYLAAFDGTWLYPAAALALFCALRRGELLALRWRDIDFTRRLITVAHSITRVDGENQMKAPKNGQKRTVCIPEGIVEILKAHKKRQTEFRLLLGNEYHKSEFVITLDDGRSPAPTYLSKAFTDRIARAGLPPVRLHDLRHTTGSLMIYEGVDIKTVSEVLGHSSINITLDVYAHVIEEAKKKAADSLDKYLKKV
ncbi:MAG: site-specific integrase [Christensenellaceae bacterium]|nr:site-specific integrase [Christensenellaceae bacterium]